jgi:hypothetical protein
MRRARIVLLPLVAGCLLSACGAGSHDNAKAPLGSESNPVPALPNPSATRVPPKDRVPGESAANSKTSDDDKVASAPAPSGTSTKTQHGTVTAKTKPKPNATVAAKSGSAATSRKTPRKQKALPVSAGRPCSLVTKTQAAAIVGGSILEPLEAPQGPTCIYQTKSGKPYVTLAVQTVDFAKLRKQIRDERAVAIASRTAYCGTYGKPMLFLPVSGGRVLSITAPCSMAQRFAAKAAAHL